MNAILFNICNSVFVTLMMVHFIGDWMMQSNHMALRKGQHRGVRLIHCFVYSACFLPVFTYLFHLSNFQVWTSFAFLLATHYYIDSKHPVYFWRRYVHGCAIKNIGGLRDMAEMNQIEGIVNLVIDQIMHALVIVAVVAWIVLSV